MNNAALSSYNLKMEQQNKNKTQLQCEKYCQQHNHTPTEKNDVYDASTKKIAILTFLY